MAVAQLASVEEALAEHYAADEADEAGGESIAVRVTLQTFLKVSKTLWVYVLLL
jgi:hypothetical protein